MNKTLSILLFTLGVIHVSVFGAGNATYEITTGKKKITPLENFISRLSYELDSSSVKAYLSKYSFEEVKTTGKVMTLKVMKRSALKYEYSDFDLSGKFEVIKEYNNGKIISESKLNEPTRTILERTLFNSNGKIIEVDNDLSKKGYFTERNIYRNGKIFKTLKDLNGDGLYEQEFIYFVTKRPQISYFEQELPQAKLGGNIKCVVGGFFNQANITTFDEELTKEVVKELKGIINSSYSVTKSYIDEILKLEKSKKALGKKFVTRIDIYKAVSKVEKKKGLFIISGKVFRTNTRISVYFRFHGPLALATIYNGSFSQSVGNFNASEVAKFISNKLKQRYIPITDEKGTQHGYKLKKAN